MSAEYFRVEERVFPGSHIREYPGATAGSQEDVLYLHAKKYTPLNQPTTLPSDAITILATHASGFHKELYEPMFDELLHRSKQNGFTIRSIWITDTVHFGQSSVINEDRLSSDYSWHDHARDLFLMVNQYRAEMPRPIVGLGHSFGGNQLANLALMHPRLLSALVLMDASLNNRAPTAGGRNPSPNGFHHVVYRKDIFKSRSEAVAALKKNGVYRKFDPRVLDRMVKYGFRDLPTALYPEVPADADKSDPPVTFTTSKHQDSWTQFRANFDPPRVDGRVVVDRSAHPDIDPRAHEAPLYRPEVPATALRLPHLRPMTAFILGEKTYLPLESVREAIGWTGTGVGGSGGVAEGRVTEITVPNGPHLFPLFMPNETADAVASWLGQAMKMYRDDEAKWRATREGRSKEDDLRLGKQWFEVVKPPEAYKGMKATYGPADEKAKI